MKPEKPKRMPKNGGQPAASKRQPAAPAKPAMRIPPILLEGDAPAAPPASGPGQRYALRPTRPEPLKTAEADELPEAYGTQRLLLAARDPHWLYAAWDLTREQLKTYNGFSIDKHLVLRVYKDAIAGQPVSETHVHPESRNWFVNVSQGGAKYLAELGYYGAAGRWTTISTSGATLTPPDSMAEDLSVWFETLPADLHFQQILQLVKSSMSGNISLLEAMSQLRASGIKGLPDIQSISAGRWTAAQERALAQVITMDAVRRVWMGSLEITELIRRQLAQEISSLGAAQFSIPGSWSGAVSSFSSPLGGMERRKGFWFNVNAELIIYGATEPDAEVTIGGRAIRLRPDGTFSYRFALPDGNYNLPAVATSADGTDSRAAGLKFSRSTEFRGEVGAHPQDPKLNPPLVKHVA
jgi:hypothetical protein